MAYDFKGKIAIVTGGGSGIAHALTRKLLDAGCSVMVADLRLRPEAEEAYKQFPHPAAEKAASVVFHKTDMREWAQIGAMFEACLATFGQVDIVVNGAGIFEPPSSSFWRPPGSELAGDPVDGNHYAIFDINTIGPIRLAQTAVEYWLRNRHVQGNLLWVVSMAGYLHFMVTPLYCASKAALVSMCRSLGPLKATLGIRNSAVCPGAVRTPMLTSPDSPAFLAADDVSLKPEELADVLLRVLREPQYGDGSVVEVQQLGTPAAPNIDVRDVPLEALYPPAAIEKSASDYMARQGELVAKLKESGMYK